jgi:carbon-monoxide dehydrogenase medium subunit
MKSATFALARPSSVEEAVAVLAEAGDEGQVLAGGQSLLALMALRLATPAVLVDLAGVPGLDRVEVAADRSVVIGAMARQRAVELDPDVARWAPLLTEAIGHIGHVAIRNQGTLGGSLAHADPAAELPAVALALDATMVLAGPVGRREVAAADLFAGYLTTCIGDDELLAEVRFPPLPAGAGSAFVELSRRHGDFALAGVAAIVQLDAAGHIAAARLSLSGVGPTPVRAGVAEAALAGERPSEQLFAAAAAEVGRSVQPEGDLHATAAYRRHLAGVLTRRALTLASRRAGHEVAT